MKGLKGKAGIRARIAGERIIFVAGSLGNDRVRTLLSLAGVSIGIFCIVASMTLFDSLQRSLREGMESFGSDIVFIEKMPLEPDLDENGLFRWWKYIGRPEPTYREYMFLREHCRSAALMTFSASFADGKVIGVSENWRCAVANPLCEGRDFLPSELSRGAAAAIAGASADLRGASTAEVGGVRIPVAGRLKESGLNSVSILGDIDGALLVPYLWARGIASLEMGKATITAKPREGVSEKELAAELTRLLKRYRRTCDGSDAGFAVNRMSFIAGEVSSIFRTLSNVGWIIGLFSLLIGGFGIANIMFVSVSERTREIGLQKALGAGDGIILFQYLSEAAFLSLSGAAAGVLLVVALCALIPSSVMDLSVSWSIAASAMGIALFIGTISGLAPASLASGLQPAEALTK